MFNICNQYPPVINNNCTWTLTRDFVTVAVSWISCLSLWSFFSMTEGVVLMNTLKCLWIDLLVTHYMLVDLCRCWKFSSRERWTVQSYGNGFSTRCQTTWPGRGVLSRDVFARPLCCYFTVFARILTLCCKRSVIVGNGCFLCCGYSHWNHEFTWKTSMVMYKIGNW